MKLNARIWGLGLAMLCFMVFFVASVTLVDVYAQPSNSRSIPTRGGSRSTTYVEFMLDENYIVKGLTAQDTLGRPAGTLSDFAAAMAGYMGEDTIIFAGNFHLTGTAEIVGAVYSHGRVVSGEPQPWLNHGIGFTASNRMELFAGRINNGRLYGYHWYEGRLDYVAAFNAYPHLINNGTSLPIAPMPGVTQAWLDGRVLRAFMGQRADGSFVIGNVAGANMLETQDVAAYMNLVNATNIDGGASAGIWRNGEYVTRPGRVLPHVVFITRVGSPAPPSQDTQLAGQLPPVSSASGGEGILRFAVGSRTFTNNGVSYTLEASPFIANDRIMVPLRVVGEALGAQNLNMSAGVITFSIDGQQFSMTVGQGLPGDMGVPTIVTGRTFVPLAFVAQEMGAVVRWDRVARAAYVYVSARYVAQSAPIPIDPCEVAGTGQHDARLIPLPIEHTIAAGDNLMNIAIRFYGNSTVAVNQRRAEFLAKYNGINVNNIQVGMAIIIPELPYCGNL